MFFEGVNRPLVFGALFLVSEWMTGYYLAFNFQARIPIKKIPLVTVKNEKNQYDKE